MLRICPLSSLLACLAGLVLLPSHAAMADPMRGEASFTAGTVGGGTCSFVDYPLSPGLFATGIGPSNWASGGKCGACLQVNGPRGSVKVMV